MGSMAKDFETKYQEVISFIDLMLNGEEITPETERLVREKAYMAFYFAYTSIKMSAGATFEEVVPEARKIVERHKAEHPYQFKPKKETRIDTLEKKVMKLENDLARLLERK